MKIFSKNHSSYPRIGDSPEHQKLRRAYNQYDKKKISLVELNDILDSTVSEVIDEQLSCGCDFITDGMIRSYDPVSHIAGKIKGFEINGLLRFFDTNFYFRQPVVKSDLKYDKPLVADEFEFTKNKAGDKASVVLTGPYSLLKMSISRSPGRPNVVSKSAFEKNLIELAEIYASEFKELKTRGAKLVQLEEPAILQNPDEFNLLKSVYDMMMKDKSTPETLVALYFGNAAPLVDKLTELQVDGICFDFTYSPGLENRLNGFPKNVGLGIVDGRNTKMENTSDATKFAEKIIKASSAEKVYITSSCGLEFLPRNSAHDKLKLCADIARVLRGDSR